MRAVVSTQWLVVIPQSANEEMPRSRSQPSRSGSPWNAELTCLVTSRSGSPVSSGLNALPGSSGRSGETSSSESWRTKTTGRPCARHSSISAATFASQSGLLRRPQYSASSNACWTSTTIRAVAASIAAGGYWPSTSFLAFLAFFSAFLPAFSALLPALFASCLASSSEQAGQPGEGDGGEERE